MAHGYIRTDKPKTKKGVHSQGEDHHKHDWKQVGKESECTICHKKSNHVDIGKGDGHPISQEHLLISNRRLT